MKYFIQAFKNYANFTGRSRRAEYWFFTLFNTLISIFLLVILMIIVFSNLEDFGRGEFPVSAIVLYAILIIHSIATFLPSLSITVRRLHDIGKSGWYQLIALIPFVGFILLLVKLCQEGTKGSNQYGQDPKGSLDLSSFGEKEVFQN